jgi:hypothetical protein
VHPLPKKIKKITRTGIIKNTFDLGAKDLSQALYKEINKDRHHKEY